MAQWLRLCCQCKGTAGSLVRELELAFCKQEVPLAATKDSTCCATKWIRCTSCGIFSCGMWDFAPVIINSPFTTISRKRKKLWNWKKNKLDFICWNESKIPHAATKIWGSQKILKITKTNLYFRFCILRHYKYCKGAFYTLILSVSVLNCSVISKHYTYKQIPICFLHFNGF